MLKAFCFLALLLLVPFNYAAELMSKERYQMVTGLLQDNATDIGPLWRCNAENARGYTILAVQLLDQFKSGKAFLEKNTKNGQFTTQEGKKILALALALREAKCSQIFFPKEKDALKMIHIKRLDRSKDSLLDKISATLFGEPEPPDLIIHQQWLQEFLDKPEDQIESALTELTRISLI
jgi:hypothetical protein